MPDPRLHRVYDAASALFIRKGYADTQVSQIAENAGISTGSIYSLFTGKRAVLHFVILATFDRHYLDADVSLPFEEVDERAIERHLSEAIDGLFSGIDHGLDGVPMRPFTDLISALFDCAASYQVAFNVINDSRSGLTQVRALYDDSVSRLHRIVLENLIYHIERGDVRQVDLPELHIRNILEGVSWWAMFVPHQVPDIELPVSRAKDIALDILKHAYLANPE